MRAFYDTTQQLHDPQFFLVRGQLQQSAEQPERVDRFLAALRSLSIDPLTPESFGREHLEVVHTNNYLDFLQNAYQQWQALPGSSSEVVANVFANRYRGGYPQSIVGRAGWHMADTACPIGEYTWRAACASANTALSAARSLMDDGETVYALCRPPGHHAFADMAGGFCFLNNAAIAAEYLRKKFDRIAILDVDVHHGNGTQAIFYNRSDVLTISTHTDPSNFYPFHWGYAEERGKGSGEGFNLNLPLPQGCSGDCLIETVASIEDVLMEFGAQALIVALGLDTSEEDPLQGMMLSSTDFTELGRVIRDFQLPVVCIQEGGYLSDSLQVNLENFLSAWLST